MAPNDQAQAIRSTSRPQQNARVPVNRASDDVLLEIFTFLVQPATPYASDRKGCHLIPTTHVCDRWRRVALDSPALWTEIPFYSLALARHFIERSLPMPIEVRLDARRIRDELRHVFVPLIPRLRKLSLDYIYALKEVQWCLDDLQSRASLLQALSLTVEDGARLWNGQPVLKNTFPALRSLELSRIRPAVPPSRNLRHFYLSMEEEDAACFPDILRVLQHSPYLETLVLYGIRMNDAEDDFPTTHTVSPLRLSYCELRNVSPGLPSALLSRVALPPTTEFYIELNNIQSLMSLRLPQAPNTLPALAGFRAIELASSSMGDDPPLCRPEHESRIVLSAGRDSDPRAPYTFLLNVRTPLETRPHMSVHSLSGILDTRAVETYTISFRDTWYVPPSSECSWNAALRDFGALRTLCVAGAGELYFELLRELSLCAEGRMTCPALECLELTDARCTNGFWKVAHTMVCARRTAAGSRFKRLWIWEATGPVAATNPWVQKISALLDDFHISRAAGCN